MVQGSLRGEVRSKGHRWLAGETASYVWLGATWLILPWLAVYVLAKLIQAGVL